MKAVGWFLDAYIEDDKAILWFKLTDGSILKLTDRYRPDFYVKPKMGVKLDDVEALLSIHPNVVRVEAEERFASLDMKKKIWVSHVWVDSVRNYRKVIRSIEDLKIAEAFYNLAGKGDLLHVQKYLFNKSYIPTSKVKIEYSNDKLINLKVLEDYLEVKPPPFTVLPFIIETSGDAKGSLKIVIFDEELQVRTVLEGKEKDVIPIFSSMVLEEDPDFLVSDNAKESISYLYEKARKHGLKTQLGRELSYSPDTCQTRFPRGRVLLNLDTYQRLGIAGVVERSRFTVAPPGLSAEWQAGRTIDSRQSFEALRRGILLPKKRVHYNFGMTAKDIVFRDRGGLLFSPEIGLHENVGELDFESMFPYIIERFNVSYETVTPETVDTSMKGFLGDLTRRFLDRRLYFKHLKKKYSKGSKEWLWCEQRQTALKGILVCIYGFSGCFANRFGNVAVYQKINQIAREALLKAVNIAIDDGFKVIYGDTDSLFLKKSSATREDYEKLAEKISQRTNLPIALDHHYKFLVFLNQSSMPEMGATRRYFGKLTTGELYYRGIDLRRYDAPTFLKEFQERLMKILFDAENIEEVKIKQFRKACYFVEETCRKIRRGEIDPLGLVVRKVLRKPVGEYCNLLPHVVAARQLEWKGKSPEYGEYVRFLYVNAGHRNPYRRVASFPLDEHVYYDRERYVELVLDVAETILGVFGFSSRGKEMNRKLTDWR